MWAKLVARKRGELGDLVNQLVPFMAQLIAARIPFKFLSVTLATLLFLLSTLLTPEMVSAQSVPSVQSFVAIYDNKQGGDCTSVLGLGGPLGSWDSLTKTCTLRRDVRKMIRIMDDGITLDGAGHQVRAGEAFAAGVFLSNVNGVTLRNLIIRNSSMGIYSDYSSDSNLLDNTITGNGTWGIFLFSSSNNRVVGNNISDNGVGGIQLVAQSGDIVTGNKVSNNVTYGIYLGTSNSNTVRDNSISYHSWGLNLWAGSNSNLVLQNNFFSSSRDPIFNADGNSTNVFNSPSSGGGNYYDGYDSRAEGCRSEWAKQFCDDPYAFPGGQDQRPWREPNGWHVDFGAIALLIRTLQ